MENIFEDIRRERKRQDGKWGIQNHNIHVWNTILSEETGEVAKAILESNMEEYRKELIQVAAVAVAAIESLERMHRFFKRIEINTFIRGDLDIIGSAVSAANVRAKAGNLFVMHANSENICQVHSLSLENGTNVIAELSYLDNSGARIVSNLRDYFVFSADLVNYTGTEGDLINFIATYKDDAKTIQHP